MKHEFVQWANARIMKLESMEKAKVLKTLHSSKVVLWPYMSSIKGTFSEAEWN